MSSGGDAEDGSRGCVWASDSGCVCVIDRRAREDSGARCDIRRILKIAASSCARVRDCAAAAELASARGVAETDAERRGVAAPLRSRDRLVRSEPAALLSFDQKELESDCSDLDTHRRAMKQTKSDERKKKSQTRNASCLRVSASHRCCSVADPLTTPLARAV